MTEVAPPPADRSLAPRWGLGDVAAGLALGILGSQVVLSIVLAATGRDPSDVDTLPLGLVALTQAGLWVGLLGVPVWATARKGRGLRSDLGLEVRARDAGLGGPLGALLQFPVLPLLYLPLLELFGRSIDDIEEPARALTERADSPVGVALLVLIVGVGAPIVEEIFYRGLLQRSLLRRGMAPPVAIGVTAVVFGLTHLQLLQLPALVLFGVLAGVLAHRTGRLGPAIFAHVGFNLVTVVALLA